MISKNLKKRIYTSIILFLLIFLILSFNIILVYSLIILGVYSILEFLNLTKKITENKIYSILINFIFYNLCIYL